MENHPLDTSDLDAADQFRPYLHSSTRLRVRRVYPGGEVYERTGTVGKTTGWKPAYLLMHRSSDHGSSDLLGPDDKIVAVKYPGSRSYTEIR